MIFTGVEHEQNDCVSKATIPIVSSAHLCAVSLLFAKNDDRSCLTVGGCSICAPTRPRSLFLVFFSSSPPCLSRSPPVTLPPSRSRLRFSIPRSSLHRVDSRHYPPRLPAQHVIIEPVAALCRLLQLQYIGSLTLSPDVSHSTAPTTEDRSIFAIRSSRQQHVHIHLRRERASDRSNYLEAGARSGFRLLVYSGAKRARQGH